MKTTIKKGKAFIKKMIHELPWSNKQAINEIYSSIELSKIDISFLPQTSFSVSSTLLLHIINDLIINKRKYILELGTGISTVYISKIIDQFNLDARFISIDQSKEWIHTVEKQLYANTPRASTQLFHIPYDEKTHWYDNEKLNLIFEANDFIFDLILIDGPDTKKTASSRSYFTKTLGKNYFKLNKSFSIFVDDTYRKEEKELSKNIAKITGGSLYSYDIYSTISSPSSLITKPKILGIDYRTQHFFNKNK